MSAGIGFISERLEMTRKYVHHLFLFAGFCCLIVLVSLKRNKDRDERSILSTFQICMSADLKGIIKHHHNRSKGGALV